ncbi:ADP-ribosylglycohydrolase family protein, partial [bacterium]|nr:ADP-ribosylglycohydrolase family protein [candidate division CSSED10-310 bacterium]
MIGAIAGDMIGSVYENRPIKTRQFSLFASGSRFTDDTVMTVAVAEAVLTGTPYREALLRWGRRYPDVGYGSLFAAWLQEDNPQPRPSWGNGSAMRVSPIGWAARDAASVLRESAACACVSHTHPDAVCGAQAVALAIFLARTGNSRNTIRRTIREQFGYDLDRTVDVIRPGYGFDVSCAGSVPEAMIACLDAGGYEDAVRNAISLGGDSDTLACMAGGIAEAMFGGVPEPVVREVWMRLPVDMGEIVDEFYRTFAIHGMAGRTPGRRMGRSDE